MIWSILILFLILLLIWILVVPVIIFLDTDRNRYFLALPGIFKATVIPSAHLFRIRFRIFFVPFTYNPFARNPGKKREKKEPEKSVKKRKAKRIPGGFKFVIQVLRSFRIRKLKLDIDTDDFTLNAWLVPVFSAMNSENIRMRTNFEGHASLLLDLRFRIGTLLRIFIINKIKSF